MSSEEPNNSLEEQVMAKATITDDDLNKEGNGDKEREANDISNNATNNNSDDNDDDIADDDSDDDSDDDDNTNSSTNMEEDDNIMSLITKALNFKETGNEQFKNNQYNQASRSYKKGINTIKHLHNNSNNNNNNDDEQITALIISLQSNLSMVYYKLENYNKSKDIADHIITKLDSKNSKAFYRRGLSYYKLGKIGNAKHDLYQALQYSPKDRNIIKEYRTVKKEYDLISAKQSKEKEKQKKALARAFSSSSSNGDGGEGSLLYSDKEEELKLRQEKQKQKLLEEEKLKEKRKIDWENDCVKRMSNNEDVLSFEEYEKQLKDKEEEEKKARKKAKKEKEEEENRRRRQQQEERRKKAAQRKQEEEEEDDDEDILTEKELQSLRGYKKTSDGRTTSYFTREQTEEEKKLLGNIAPQKLEPVPTSDTTSLLSTKTNASPRRLDSSISSSSAWNQAGTWEEKDTSEWCNDTLEKYLKQTQVTIQGEAEQTTSSFEAVITKVKDLKGDASVAFVSGKKRYVFDYSTDLSYEIICTNDETKKTIAKGSLHLPDVSSTSISDEEIEVQIMRWKKSPSDENEANAIRCRQALINSVREQVFAFVSAFNAQY